jgi:hypothetical protein
VRNVPELFWSRAVAASWKEETRLPVLLLLRLCTMLLLLFVVLLLLVALVVAPLLLKLLLLLLLLPISTPPATESADRLAALSLLLTASMLMCGCDSLNEKYLDAGRQLSYTGRLISRSCRDRAKPLRLGVREREAERGIKCGKDEVREGRDMHAVQHL